MTSLSLPELLPTNVKPVFDVRMLSILTIVEIGLIWLRSPLRGVFLSKSDPCFASFSVSGLKDILLSAKAIPGEPGDIVTVYGEYALSFKDGF